MVSGTLLLVLSSRRFRLTDIREPQTIGFYFTTIIMSDVSLTLSPALRTVFLLLGCLARPHIRLLSCLSLSYFVLFGCCLLVACSFLKREWKGVVLGENEGGEEMERVEDVLYEKKIYFQ